MRNTAASRLSPGWFATVRIPLLSGRDFTWQDRAGTPSVVIVDNETLARQFWNGAAVGQQIMNGSTTSTVIGVVRDSKYGTLGEATSPTVYLPFRQALATYPPTLHVRTTNPRATAERIRHAHAGVRARCTHPAEVHAGGRCRRGHAGARRCDGDRRASDCSARCSRRSGSTG